MLTSSTQLQNKSFHVEERTRISSKCQKMKNARAKRAKLLFFTVKYANLWGFCCRRRPGCLSSLLKLVNKNDIRLLTCNNLYVHSFERHCLSSSGCWIAYRNSGQNNFYIRSTLLSLVYIYKNELLIRSGEDQGPVTYLSNNWLCCFTKFRSQSFIHLRISELCFFFSTHRPCSPTAFCASSEVTLVFSPRLAVGESRYAHAQNFRPRSSLRIAWFTVHQQYQQQGNCCELHLQIQAGKRPLFFRENMQLGT